MTVTTTTKRNLVIAGFAVTALVAAAGWMRNPAPSAAAAVTPAHFNHQMAALPPGTQAYYYTPGQALTPMVAVPAPAGTPIAVVPQGPAPAPAPRQVVRSSAPARIAAPARTTTATRNKRSNKESVAIVAGSAGVGAAIGGIAAGGKGAALGGISGGAAGFVYDRLTRNK
jgi:hypothetical protein